jgi:hypothetical protein
VKGTALLKLLFRVGKNILTTFKHLVRTNRLRFG